MKDGAITPLVVLFVCVLTIGAAVIVASMTPLLPSGLSSPGVRAAGFSLFFLGLGEYLNHPLQTRLLRQHLPDADPIEIPSRRRNPCGLGNVLDVLAVICFFVALSFFFFPYQG